MKNLVLIIHANMQHDLADRLRLMPQVKSFTFIEVQGHDTQDKHDAFLSTRDKVVGYTPKIKADILLDDQDVAEVLQSIRKVVKHSRDQGFYWLLPVDESGQLQIPRSSYARTARRHRWECRCRSCIRRRSRSWCGSTVADSHEPGRRSS